VFAVDAFFHRDADQSVIEIKKFFKGDPSARFAEEQTKYFGSPANQEVDIALLLVSAELPRAKAHVGEEQG
jgi:hypothetical protein